MKDPYNSEIEILCDLFDLRKSTISYELSNLSDVVLKFYDFGKNAVAIQREDVATLLSLQFEILDILTKPGVFSFAFRRHLSNTYYDKLPEDVKYLHRDIKNTCKVLEVIKQAECLYNNPKNI